jgi:divalent metal cation (Fe/Co/Zn/Cd) transporter
VVPYQNLTLKEAHKILTKINAAVSERFGIEETTVIHLARLDPSVDTGPHRIQTRVEPTSLSLFVYG